MFVKNTQTNRQHCRSESVGEESSLLHSITVGENTVLHVSLTTNVQLIL